MKVRKITEHELQKLHAGLDYYMVPDDILPFEDAIVLEGRFREVFLPGELMEEVLGNLHLLPVYEGIKIGELVKGGFRSSLEFGTIIYPAAQKNTIVLDEKLSQLFLYGRDIFKENLPKGESLGRKLVGSSDGEFLGFAIFNGKLLANIIDKGAYLRKYE